MLKVISYLGFVLLLHIHLTSGYFKHRFVNVAQYTEADDVGEPLMLTPLIKQNKIKEAQAAAKVVLDGAKNIESYSGYLTVNEMFSSDMFFWFFPSKNDRKTDPILLWLQGGPGDSSLYGLFTEHGPFLVTNETKLKLRDISWINNHSVLYIDNPIGTGFSTTNYGYASEETQIGDELYNALLQFFKLFPQLQKNDFYITGEAYAGKYVPAIGYTIWKNNPKAQLKINLQGMVIGNGFSDPATQILYGDYLYQLGLIDINQRDIYRKYEKIIQQSIEAKNYNYAYKVNSVVSDYFEKFTGLTNVYNYLSDGKAINDLEKQYLEYIEQPDIRRALHVGATEFDQGWAYFYLIPDYVQTVAPWVRELLSNYRMLFYVGQLDVFISYSTVLNFLQHLNFSSQEVYKTAPRQKWYVGKDLAGYVKVAGNLSEVLVRDAGLRVPHDQPEWAFDLIYRFVRNKSLYGH